MVVLAFETHWLVHYDVFLTVLESEDFHLCPQDQHKGYFGTEKRRRNENLPSPDTSCKSGNASHQDFYRENSGWSQLSWSGQRVSPNWLLWWYDFTDLISTRFIIQIPFRTFMFITSFQGLAWKKSALPACHPCAWGYGSECVRQVRIDCFMKVIHLVQLGKEVIRKIRMLGCARHSKQDDFLVQIWPLAIASCCLGFPALRFRWVIKLGSLTSQNIRSDKQRNPANLSWSCALTRLCLSIAVCRIKMSQPVWTKTDTVCHLDSTLSASRGHPRDLYWHNLRLKSSLVNIMCMTHVKWCSYIWMDSVNICNCKMYENVECRIKRRIALGFSFS